jgi:DNA-binding transcriptional LysR family regulator
VRQGRRFTAVTDAGREIVATIDRVLAELANLRASARSSRTTRRARSPWP